MLALYLEVKGVRDEQGGNGAVSGTYSFHKFSRIGKFEFFRYRKAE